MSLQEFIDESVAVLTDTGLMPEITASPTSASLPEIRKQLRTHLALRFAAIALPAAVGRDGWTSADTAASVHKLATQLAERFVPISRIELDQ